MNSRLSSRHALIRVTAAVLAITLVAGIVALLRIGSADDRMHITAYFDNTNGIFPGDEVRILGVPVGRIDAITPQPDGVKVTLWVDKKFKVPADAQAAILSPSLVTARALQLTPAYTGGPAMDSGAVISQDRTVVPVEWDDLRMQLQKLSETLQPAAPGEPSPLGAFVDTAANNLHGEGANIRDAVIKMSQAFSALGDHSKDMFGTVKNLSTLVSALSASTDVMRQLNGNLASVSALFVNAPDEVGRAVADLNTAVTDVNEFLDDNSEAVGTTSDKLASISVALGESRDEIEQFLHIVPTTASNFLNIYQPAQGTLSGILGLNNFANPVSFLCGAIQAASRLNAEQSAKLCVQYMAPIIKNRQYNFLPVGINPFVGAQARPNELTYSEDWLRPDYRPAPAPPPQTAQLPAESPITPDPSQGLTGLMVPPEAGR